MASSLADPPPNRTTSEMTAAEMPCYLCDEYIAYSWTRLYNHVRQKHDEETNVLRHSQLHRLHLLEAKEYVQKRRMDKRLSAAAPDSTTAIESVAEPIHLVRTCDGTHWKRTKVRVCVFSFVLPFVFFFTCVVLPSVVSAFEGMGGAKASGNLFEPLVCSIDTPARTVETVISSVPQMAATCDTHWRDSLVMRRIKQMSRDLVIEREKEKKAHWPAKLGDDRLQLDDFRRHLQDEKSSGKSRVGRTHTRARALSCCLVRWKTHVHVTRCLFRFG